MRDITLEMAQSLSKLIRFPSVGGEPADGAPFGADVKDCLNYFLSLAESFGFGTRNYDGYAGEVVFGEGEDFAILCHLDVVPAGGNWSRPPFSGDIDFSEGRIYGRGAVDDKGPAIACLFAMKALKDGGFRPARTVKLIVGCNEESGWRCLEHYKKCARLPEEGFSPDAEFPVIYAEKGIMHVEFRFPAHGFSDLTGGGATNVVCDLCSVVCPADEAKLAKYMLTFENGRVISRGKSAHGSTPERGKNAISPVLLYLGEYKAHELLFENFFHLKGVRDETGELTFSPNVVRQENGFYYVACDIRYPVTYDRLKILEKFESEHIPYKILHEQAPSYVDRDSPLVKNLCAVYEEVTRRRAQPVAIGGGTYARALSRGVAFGPVDVGDADVVHRPDEFITFSQLEKCYDIYKLALERLTKSR